MKNYITGLLVCLAASSYAQQESDQLANKRLFNKLEYFINSQQTDSIYELGSSTFKKELRFDFFADYLRKNVYKLGRIRNATIANFENGNALYNLAFDDAALRLLFSVDSSYKFQTLTFLPATINTEASQVVTESTVAATAEPSKPESLQQQRSPQALFVDSLAAQYLQQHPKQSLSIGIINKGVTERYFYGETSKGNQTLPTATSIYEIGSLSKLFTAILLADLVEKKTINLNDSIAKFLPDSVRTNPALKNITFQQLANHTSGLPRLPDNLEKTANFTEADPYRNYGKKELYAYLKNMSINAGDAEQYAYSNLGFAVLGDLIQTITKKSYEQLLNEVISTPLNLTHTAVQVNPKLYTLLQGMDNEGKLAASWNFQSFAAAGGIKSSLEDLLIFAKAQFKMPETPIEQAMALTKQFTFFLPPTTDIGLAWHISMYEDLISYQHTGQTAGSSSYIILTPDHKSAVVVLSNASAPVDTLGDKLIDRVLSQ
ncbi:beta-lactamase family protein [Sphingobacteriaceae bacterium WQ 2009]|uniref:Beta-lactamase n=1 Tax=Rhinopithecimicrobium faecis TaxID=2820698 RepID=A0A8T4HE65_9SPHI|nr:beta-lactamase family protein [Sphingobacteriaceae bacterium WQ 2009]